MANDASPLALFQSRFLQLLWEEDDVEAIRRQLLEDAALAPFHAYIASMEPRMMEVAAELVRKWGRSA